MTAVLIDTTFLQTAEALARYMKSLGPVECKTLCAMVRLSTAGVIATMRNRLIRAVERNLGLMQLATVSGVELTVCRITVSWGLCSMGGLLAGYTG